MKDGSTGRNAAASRSRNAATTNEWPCVFGGEFVREQVDPRIKAEWAAARADKPKFGDLRNTFRREHCRALNPWGSETCPFKEADCGIAFLKAVQESLVARNAHGYFIKVARSSGALRADMAVERRAMDARMRTSEEEAESRGMGSTHPARLRARPDAGVAQAAASEEAAESGPPDGSVRRPLSRPQRIGTLLGAPDLQPRPSTRGGRDEHEGR